MAKVAVTGGAGTGKTAVCDCLRELGAHVINLDELAREAVQPGSPALEAIVDRFGRNILKADGSLDRTKLRGIITRDAQDRKVVEMLTHPEILRLFKERVTSIESRHEDAVVVTEVPLLIELGLQDQFDLVILVEADSEQQEMRLMARDGASAAEAQALMGIQMAAREKRTYADYVVKNQGSLQELRATVREMYRKIAKTA